MRAKWPEWLKDLLDELDVNQKGLAALVDKSPSTVGHWLNGTKPDSEAIIALARLGKISPARLWSIVWELPLEAGSEETERDAYIAAAIQAMAPLTTRQRQGIIEAISQIVRNFTE